MDQLFNFVGRGLTDLHVASAMAAANNSTVSGSKNYSLEKEVRVLKENLWKSMLINEALWEIISGKLDVPIKELYDKLYEIDMRDGQLDGKNQQKASLCPKCSRKVSPRHSACLYCGHPMDSSLFSVD